MSDTPRTDALWMAVQEADAKYGYGIRQVMPDDPICVWEHARQLERELTEAIGDGNDKAQAYLRRAERAERKYAYALEKGVKIEHERDLCTTELQAWREHGKTYGFSAGVMLGKWVVIQDDAAPQAKYSMQPQSGDVPIRGEGPAAAAPCDAYVQGRDSDRCERCGLGEFEHGQIY